MVTVPSELTMMSPELEVIEPNADTAKLPVALIFVSPVVTTAALTSAVPAASASMLFAVTAEPIVRLPELISKLTFELLIAELIVTAPVLLSSPILTV